MDPLRVLVVDDEEELVEALVERLNMRGIEAVGVTSGSDALLRLDDEEYDVVLLDMKMPAPGGLEVLRELKARWPDRQVVLLTGHGSKHDVQLGMQLGAFEYVMKPVDIDELMPILIRAAVAKNGGGG
jgi:two-component system OmpR family response regulator